jgi:hypothetical protein
MTWIGLELEDPAPPRVHTILDEVAAFAAAPQVEADRRGTIIHMCGVTYCL